MGFGQAISTCFSKYATFSGRARRSEFWWWVVFVIIVSIVTNFIDGLFGTRYVYTTSGGTTVVSSYSVGYISSLATLILLLPGISVAVRRLHDTGKSGWWWWLNIVCCIGTIILIVFYAQDSTMDNKYGPNPKGAMPPPGGAPPAVA